MRDSRWALNGPERDRGQGIGPEQNESADLAIHHLLSDPQVCDQVDLVATWRRDPDDAETGGAYEVWSRRGRVRFRRAIDGGGALDFEVVDVLGENPIANQDASALASLQAEKDAALRSGFEADDAARRFIAPAEQSYPFAYERVAQLFDSPNAPDLAISVMDWAFGTQPGTHGALHVRQARAPLWISGRGVATGRHSLAVRSVDIAPTVLEILGFPKIDGRDATGRRSSERGAAPDVLLARQDGRVASEILDPEAEPPLYLHIFLLDGLHPTELDDRIENDPDALPNLRRLRERAAQIGFGSIVNFPSITWPSHTTIGTGTWCGHHDVVNPSYYLREKRETVSPQGQQLDTERFSNDEVESLYEAFARVRGDDCTTAAIFAPFGRGADHAVLEGRNLCHRPHLRALNEELRLDADPRWQEDGAEEAINESGLDTRGIAQLYDLFRREDVRSPDFVFHELILTDGVGHDYGPHSEGLRAALDESDRRVGRVLDLLDEQGRFEDTLFVVTADHGMAPQDVALRANPARHLLTAGMSAVVADAMVWLLDVAVETTRAPDGRTGRVIVRENDALASGERPPIEGARVRVMAHLPGQTPSPVAEGETGAGGVFGFSTPAELDTRSLAVHISASGFNDRHLRLDGSPLTLDLPATLYSD
jgi:hypothetical protein